MKLIFAGLILLGSITATAQITTPVNHQAKKKLTAQKMREVILADEQQHEAKAPIMLNKPLYVESQKLPSPGYQVVRINYVTQHRNALMEGLGTGLSIAKQFTRYGNTPSMNYSDLQNYYRVPQQPTKR